MTTDQITLLLDMLNVLQTCFIIIAVALVFSLVVRAFFTFWTWSDNIAEEQRIKDENDLDRKIADKIQTFFNRLNK